MLNQSTYDWFELSQSDSWISREGMCLESGRTDNFYVDTMDLILELFRPIEWVTIGLNEDHFPLKDAHSIKVSFVIFL